MRHVLVIDRVGHVCPPRATSSFVVGGQQRHLLAALEQARQRLEALDLLLELGDVLEAAVDGREPHVRDLVEPAQLLHDEIADEPARHLALAERLQVMLDVLDAALDVLALHGTFLERVQEAAAQLVDVERLAAIVALDDVRHDELGHLERRESLAARQALAAAAHLAALAGKSRVRHLRILEIAERAMHDGRIVIVRRRRENERTF